MPENGNKTTRPRRKMGKTILVSPQRDSNVNVDESNLTKEKCIGLQKSTEKDGKFFLLFDNYNNAKNALYKLRNEFNYFVKFAHYKVFFKCDEVQTVTPSSDFEHDTFKNLMRNLVQNNTNGHVLYPPVLYKDKNSEDDKYTGCGYITVDTKESEEQLLGDMKESTMDDKYKLTFYRYRLHGPDETDNVHSKSL